MVAGYPFIYRIDGALPSNYPYYVQRRSDAEALNFVKYGQPVFTTAPRQMGKTSLLMQLRPKLRSDGWLCAYLDLSTLQNLSYSEWFRHIGQKIALECGLNDISAFPATPQDLDAFLMNQIGLVSRDVRLGLFLDEVESMKDKDFSDIFWATLRSRYQQQENRNLCFVLTGCHDPGTLVHDPTISPFNIAAEISLFDFTEFESRSLTIRLSDLGLPVEETSHACIYAWTHGHPYLTQRLCQEIENRVRREEIPSVTNQVVDDIVYNTLLKPGHFDKNVRHMLNEVKRLPDPAADLWRKLLAGETVLPSSSGFIALNLTGAVRVSPENRQVILRNRLYVQALERTASPGQDKITPGSEGDYAEVAQGIPVEADMSNQLTSQFSHHDLVAAQNFLEELAQQTRVKTNSQLAAALQSLRETRVTLGDPRDNLRRLTPEQFGALASEAADAGKPIFDYYYLTLTASLQPKRGALFNLVESSLQFGPPAARPIVQKYFPKPEWKEVLAWGGAMRLGLTGDLDWQAEVDLSQLPAHVLSALPAQVKSRLVNTNNLKALIVVPDYTFRLGRAEILATGEGSSRLFWRIEKPELQQMQTVFFSVIFKVTHGTSAIRLTGLVAADCDINWLVARPRHVVEDWQSKFKALFPRKGNRTTLPIGDYREWELLLPGATSPAPALAGMDTANSTLPPVHSTSNLPTGKGGAGQPSRVQQAKKLVLDDQLASLLKDYEAVNGQLNSAVSELDRNRLRRQLENLEKQMADIERQLNDLAAQG